MKMSNEEISAEEVRNAFSKLGEDVQELQKKIRPNVNVVETENDDGEKEVKMVVNGLIDTRWFNLKYLNKMFGEYGLEIVEKDGSSTGSQSSGTSKEPGQELY